MILIGRGVEGRGTLLTSKHNGLVPIARMASLCPNRLIFGLAETAEKHPKTPSFEDLRIQFAEKFLVQGLDGAWDVIFVNHEADVYL